MDSIFKISKNGVCGITVSGLELDNDEYLSEDNVIISTRNYTYKQSVTINILKSINSKQEETIQESKVVLHNVDCLDECSFEMQLDGLHSITHLILPTLDWLNNVIQNSKESLDAYFGVYIYDTNNNRYLKYIKDSLEEVLLEEILEVNAVPPTTVSNKTTTIIKNEKNTFQLCHLMECYYLICKLLLVSLPSRCPDKSPEISTLTLYRDLLWMTINVIKYLLEKEQYYEASRVLEDITYCGSLCNNIIKTNKNSSSCECSKG